MIISGTESDVTAIQELTLVAQSELFKLNPNKRLVAFCAIEDDDVRQNELDKMLSLYNGGTPPCGAVQLMAAFGGYYASLLSELEAAKK